MKKVIEISEAIAETVKNCGVEVVGAYPITPSTHIAEKIAKFWADGEIPEFIPVESEHSAFSTILGAAATGARTFTTTSSQGLLLAHEVLFNISGMRLPCVIFVANRAVSAPLSIWCDHQDTISQRDCGWIQIYVKNGQEAVDSIVQAYRIAEEVFLPVMVCGDGFFLTHAVEEVDIPDEKIIKKYLKPLKMKIKLDPKNPVSLGAYATPEHYQSFREDLSEDMEKSKDVIIKADKEWKKLTGRSYGLFENYMCDDAKSVIVAMGAQASNGKEAVNKLRKEGEKVGILILRVFRPFPYEEIREVLNGKEVLVLDRSVSPGANPPLYSEILNAVRGEVYSFVGGLGGKDLNVDVFIDLFKRAKRTKRTKSKNIKRWI